MRRHKKLNMNRRAKLNVETLEARRLLTTVWADFNNDGFDDLAVGTPGEDSGAGLVQVLYGSATGLTATGSQTLSQTILGTDTSEAGDNFGAALAGGDYNNDGFTDLAVGVPGEDIGAATDAGLVHFILGSATGLTGAGDYVLHEDTNRVRDISETGDNFGKSLAAGDFDNDGFVDLGVGVPGQDIPGKVDAGGVHIFYGGGQGIKPPGNQTFNLDSPAMSGTADAGDGYGSALSAGDFNGDGRADLAIGVPNSTASDFGHVAVMHGSANGLSPVGSQLHTDPGSGAGHKWGSALAAGDYNGDGRDDLAAGAPFGELAALTPASGTVTILFGTATGLTVPGFQKFHQSDFIPSGAETGDHWGSALTAANFDTDGFDDLVIGAPDEDVGATADAGSVDVVHGSASGITTSGDANFTQESMSAVSEVNDHFGESLGAGDFNGNGTADLAVGTPDEDIGAAVDAGTVYVIYTIVGPTPQTWNQDTTGIFDTAETGDSFGSGLDANGSKSAPGGSGRQDPRSSSYRRCRFRHAHQQTQQTPQPERPALTDSDSLRSLFSPP